MGVDRRIHIGASEPWTGVAPESLEIQHQNQEERPYGEAIQMIHKGATAASLGERLGLSRSEAELMVMLHGVRKAS